MSVQRKFNVRVRLWIESGKGPFLGLGRIVLLKKIQETGSINSAAKTLRMSYRQAWQLVKEMNERSSGPLVIKKNGGKNGGGTSLTQKGEKVIRAWQKLEKKVQTFVDKEATKFQF
jgi:molybdate transport system regulatory protein